MPQLPLISTWVFIVALAGFILPWTSILKGWPFALVGYKIAMGQYNIPPTEYYVLLVAVLAAGGAVMPHVMPERRTVQRVLFAGLAVSVLLLMRVQLPNGIDEVQWRMGYYVTGTSLVVVLGLNAFVLGGRHRRKRRRQRRRRR